jgi:Na+-driven multidrug efflux pump
VVAYAVLFVRGHPDLPVRAGSLAKLDPAMLLGLARVGTPYCLIGMLFSGVYLWYAHLATSFGDASLAVLGIGNRLESITYLTADGFAVAASTFVGQNLGARDSHRAEKGAWWAVSIMSAIGAALGLLFLLLPGPLLSIFTRDAEVIRLGIPYIRILAICQLFTGLEGAVGGGFAGAGNTVPPMIVHAAFALLRVPLAMWAVFDLGMGVTGIAWTMSLTCVFRGAILALWFRRGKWKMKALPVSMRPLPPAEEPEPTIVA